MIQLSSVVILIAGFWLVSWWQQRRLKNFLKKSLEVHSENLDALTSLGQLIQHYGEYFTDCHEVQNTHDYLHLVTMRIDLMSLREHLIERESYEAIAHIDEIIEDVDKTLNFYKPE